MKNTWIRDSGASCHIINNDTGLYDVTNIDKSIKGSSSIMPDTKKGKLQVMEPQVVGTKQVLNLWPVKFCPKAGANLFSLTYKLLQGNKISSDHQNNIMVKTLTSNIILDCRIKTRDSCVAGVAFLHEANNQRAVSATPIPKKNINNLYIELGHPSKTITCSTTRPLASMSPVHSNHVKIVPSEKPSNKQSAKRLYLDCKL